MLGSNTIFNEISLFYNIIDFNTSPKCILKTIYQAIYQELSSGAHALL